MTVNAVLAVRCYEGDGAEIHYFVTGSTCQCGKQPTATSADDAPQKPRLRVVEGTKAEEPDRG